MSFSCEFKRCGARLPSKLGCCYGLPSLIAKIDAPIMNIMATPSIVEAPKSACAGVTQVSYMRLFLQPPFSHYVLKVHPPGLASCRNKVFGPPGDHNGH
mmetsp:Transcript_22153/g.43191  ORF Transcript_22153/g.43191 Transcript_22153/m.43191 type:complete len:99 (+) Transcript_22153:70-366(+)